MVRVLDHYKSLPSDFASKVGYSANVITKYVDGNTYYPGFNPSGYFSSQEQWNVSRTGDSWHHRASYSKLIGSHMLKVGAEYNRVQWYYENGVTTIGSPIRARLTRFASALPAARWLRCC